ncbi:unnamed protein product [Effrenium voratum]|uniref:Uncharacterized protein n=1 Tax=Effrenium voratum TaxID=2562239 RepID=A0AA36JTA2_9DINO|nr:unnamed protein product [Effrenium voratum]|mmetsp:Transcript_120100/g.285320  ORF Transcript_120100/g.285320 Transcript_120100/m.285320 type:complete len:327 (+) Transcript_120100:67-1047(+)
MECHDAQDETLTESVKRLKAVLDNSLGSKEEVLKALDQLQALGNLPTRILSETLVGKSLHGLAKAAADPEVKNKAKGLELAWRQAFKKRKASGDDLQLKRSNSTDEIFPEPGPGGAGVGGQSLSQDFDEEARLDRASSSMSLASQGDGKNDESYREKVRLKLVEALGKEEGEIEAKGGETQQSMRDPVRLAEDIEEELNKALPKKEAYMHQARSILFNLKDSRNSTFRFKVMVGFFSPNQLPSLTAEDMASDEKNDERRKHRQYAMEALDQGWALKNGQQLTTGMFTCGKCKGNKTTYFQMQTRSSDEPMTTFVTCLTCSNRWKFC